MPEAKMQTCVYHILRYAPNLIRDEWVNIGVLLHSPEKKLFRLRMIGEEEELARLRRLHPEADLAIVNALQSELEKRLAESAAAEGDIANYVAKLDDTLSNVLQLGPQKGLLTEDFEGDFDRLYRDHVAPPRARVRAGLETGTRGVLRTRMNEVFRSAGVLGHFERGVRVDEFTYRGDPMKLDYSYRRNGTRGFVHALALARDPAQAKVLAYTADCIRRQLGSTEFAAVTETAPKPDSERHQFVAGLLAEQHIQVVPLAALEAFTNRLRPELH